MSATNQGQNSAEMDSTALRMRVAELCGWKSKLVPTAEEMVAQGYTECQHTWWTDASTGNYGLLPDYPNDLNACHEFEGKLQGGEIVAYDRQLKRIYSDRFFWHATAEQRCRAFVETMEARSVGQGTEKSLAAPGKPKSLEEH